MTRSDRALAIIVLAVDPSLLYLLGDPKDPRAVWQKLENNFNAKPGQTSCNYGENFMH